MSLLDTIKAARQEAAEAGTLPSGSKKADDANTPAAASDEKSKANRSRRSSAASARTTRDRAGSVRTGSDKPKSEMTKEEKRAEREKRREKEDVIADAKRAMLDSMPEYKHTQRIWWGMLIAGIIWWVLTVPLCAVSGQGIAAQLKSALPGAFAISCGMLALSLIFDKVTGKESLGGGDIKLFFMTGLYLGPAGGLLQLICACLTGLLFSAAVKKERIPFGPAISLAAFLALIAGGPVISWYMGLFL